MTSEDFVESIMAFIRVYSRPFAVQYFSGDTRNHG